MKDVGRRLSQGSHTSIDNALINVAKSQISTSMSKLNQNEVRERHFCMDIHLLT